MGYCYIFKFSTPTGYAASFDFEWPDWPLPDFAIRSLAYPKFKAECAYLAYLIREEDFVRACKRFSPALSVKTPLDGAEFEGIAAPMEGESPVDIPSTALPVGFQQFVEVEDLPKSVQHTLRKGYLRRDDVNNVGDLDELVYNVETKLWDITHKSITTKHAEACLRAHPRMIIALERWVEGAIRKWEENVKAGAKPKEGPNYVEGKLYVTSCYRRLGTTCDWDTHGYIDATDPTGHWTGFGVDVTNIGKKNYFGSTFDPPLTVTEINKAAKDAGLVQDRKFKPKDPVTGEPKVDPVTGKEIRKLETWHWRLKTGGVPLIK
jgi:hypothetical protein